MIRRRTGWLTTDSASLVVDYVSYLEECAAGLRIQTETSVERIDPENGRWTLTTNRGPVSTSEAVVSTGPDLQPVLPDWADRSSFPGTLLHAGEFRNVDEVRGKNVLVVGPGNSGVDLLNHLVLSDVGRLWLSARSGMHIVPAWLGPVPLHLVAVSGRYLPTKAQDLNIRLVQRLAFGDLEQYGYPRSELGALTRIGVDNVTVAVDDGFVAALKAGRVEMRPGVERLEGPTVRFTDDSTCEPDVIICATGYRPGLEPLVGHFLPLDHIGMPPFVGIDTSPEHPGLWFFGLNRSPYGNMHIRRREARRLAQLIADGHQVGKPEQGTS